MSWKNIISKNLGEHITPEKEKKNQEKQRGIRMSLKDNRHYLKHLKQLLSNEKQKDTIAEIKKEIRRVESQIDYLRSISNFEQV